jgi:hypothetical protein
MAAAAPQLQRFLTVHQAQLAAASASWTKLITA